MKNSTRRFAAFLLVSLGLLVPLQAVEASGESKSFKVSKGGALEVSTGAGDIRVTAWEKREVFVEAIGINPDDLDRLEMTQTGNTVRVEYDPRWDSKGRIRFDIKAPSEFNLDLRTSGGDLQIRGSMTGTLEGSTAGGDIILENVNGTVNMSTSGGDISCGRVQGDVNLKTSGGDIELGDASGKVEVTTSGGDIHVGNVGKTLRARTAGGDIQIGDVGGEAVVSTAGGDVGVGRVSGRASISTAGGDIELGGASGTVKVSTAGGDIELEDITGSIEAKTAGGDIHAELMPSGKGRSMLESAGGDLLLYVPDNAKATIEASIEIYGGRGWSEGYDIQSDFEADQYEKDEDEREIRGTYKINGGGELISLKTVNGNIEIRKMKK